MANVPDDIKNAAPKGKALISEAKWTELRGLIATAYAYGRWDNDRRRLSESDGRNASIFEQAMQKVFPREVDLAIVIASLHDIYNQALAAKDAAESPQLSLTPADMDTED